MRPHQIFAAMTPEKAEAFFARVNDESRETFQQTVAAAAITLKYRPQYLMKQPKAKKINSVRKALSRMSSSQLAEEVLALYFLRCRLELLTEWLDLVGLEHEEGILTSEDVSSPETAVVEENVARFRKADPDDEDRELLLQAFSAQTAIEWPALEALLQND